MRATVDRPGGALPWLAENRMPAVPEGTFDAAALLASVLRELRPVLVEQLRQVAIALETDLLAEGAAPGGASDALRDLRTDLLRRILPQFSEAVRAGVLDGMRVRSMHLAQLAAIDRTSWRTASLSVLQKRVAEEVAKAGVERVTEPDDLSLFQLAEGSPKGSEDSELRVLAPAYRDQESGRVVEVGWATAEPLPDIPLRPGKVRHQKVHERQAVERAARLEAKALAAEESTAPTEEIPVAPAAESDEAEQPSAAASVAPVRESSAAVADTALDSVNHSAPDSSQEKAAPSTAELAESAPASTPATDQPSRRTSTPARRPGVPLSVARFTSKFAKREAP